MRTVSIAHIDSALRVLARPQHPEHVAQARALLAVPTTLSDLWNLYLSGEYVGEVWGIASLAWHMAPSTEAV
jgi:hypothetical protein